MLLSRAIIRCSFANNKSTKRLHLHCRWHQEDKNGVFTEVSDTSNKFPREMNEVLGKIQNKQDVKENRMDILYLLNSIQTSEYARIIFEKNIKWMPLSVDNPEDSVNELGSASYSLLEFESNYGRLSDKIRSAQITFNRTGFAAVKTLKSWVVDNVISAFLMLLNHNNVYALDTTFSTIFLQSLRLKYITSHGEFLRYFYASSELDKLMTCHFVLIPLSKRKLKI